MSNNAAETLTEEVSSPTFKNMELPIYDIEINGTDFDKRSSEVYIDADGDLRVKVKVDNSDLLSLIDEDDLREYLEENFSWKLKYTMH